jgi:GTP-binding protein
MSYLDDSAVPYQIVLTKTDKIKPNALAKRIEYFKLQGKEHPACHPEVVCTSSSNKNGIDDLRVEITSFLSA